MGKKMRLRRLFFLVFFVFSAHILAEEADSVSVTILYDNYLYQENLQTDWGFSCLIEGLEKTILFDTGTHGDILAANAEKLGVDFGKVDAVVISHNHRDHFGGLETFLAINNQVDVFLLTDFTEALSPVVQDAGAKVRSISAPTEICKGVWLTGEMGDRIREQSLVLQTGEGLVVITGCAHPGVIRIIEKAKEILPEEVYAVLGGFHLLQNTREQVAEKIGMFRQLGVRHAGPSHCTGESAIEQFHDAYGDRFIRLGAGRTLWFARTAKEHPAR